MYYTTTHPLHMCMHFVMHIQIILQMYSNPEQPFYIVVTDGQSKECTYVRVVFEKSINSVALVLVCGCTNVELIKYVLHHK